MNRLLAFSLLLLVASPAVADELIDAIAKTKTGTIYPVPSSWTFKIARVYEDHALVTVSNGKISHLIRLDMETKDLFAEQSLRIKYWKRNGTESFTDKTGAIERLARFKIVTEKEWDAKRREDYPWLPTREEKTRTWTPKGKQPFEGRYITCYNGKAMIKRGTDEIYIKVSDLTHKNRTWLENGLMQSMYSKVTIDRRRPRSLNFVTHQAKNYAFSVTAHKDGTATISGAVTKKKIKLKLDSRKRVIGKEKLGDAWTTD